MKKNNKKRKKHSDDDYSEDDEEEPKPKRNKVTAIDTAKPQKPAKENVEWREGDEVLIREGLLNLGNDYCEIKRRYFRNRPDVGTKDINNKANRTSELKKIVESNSKNKKKNIVTKFKNNCLEEKAIVSKQAPTISSIEGDDDDCVQPKQLQNGLLVPSNRFLKVPPFFTELEHGYHYCYRYHYAELLDFQVLPDRRVIEWKFKNEVCLSVEEMQALKLLKEPLNGKEVKYADKDNRVTYYISILPEDADLNARVQLNYLETASGGLLEVVIKKISKNQLFFEAPRRNITTSIRSTQVDLVGHIQVTQTQENNNKESST